MGTFITKIALFHDRPPQKHTFQNYAPKLRPQIARRQNRGTITPRQGRA